MVIGNFVDFGVRWGEHGTIAEAVGAAQPLRPLRLAFEFSGHARLYSFWLSLARLYQG